MVIILTLQFTVNSVVYVTVAAAVLLIGDVVGYNVNNNLDAHTLGSGTQGLELVFASEPGLVTARNTDTERLVELPPLTTLVTPVSVIVLGGLYGRSLDSGVSRRLDGGKVVFNRIVRPVKAMKNCRTLDFTLRTCAFARYGLFCGINGINGKV